jgi:uroporphyrinogen decarboxylase
MTISTKDAPFLAALRGESPARRPIWIMRQAGRYLPEYLAVREKTSFIDLCKTPELAAEVTLQPIRRFGFDAAILFSDILVLLEPMGAAFKFGETGPTIDAPIRSEKQIEALRVVEPREYLGYVAETIRILKGELGSTPLIGFAGAPFTLASYLVEGGGSKDYKEVKTLMFSRPELFLRLMDKLADQVAAHLLMQVEAGADAVQLFDSWAGALSPEDYERFCLPGVKRIMAALSSSGVPRILFAKGCAPYLELLAGSGADALGLDWTTKLRDALPRVGWRPVQGNLDPLLLFGPEAEIRRRAIDICRAGDEGPGHVFNLGHGILPKTPIAAVEALVDTVQSYKRGD